VTVQNDSQTLVKTYVPVANGYEESATLVPLEI